MPRALIHPGSDSWYIEFRTDRTSTQLAPPNTSATAPVHQVADRPGHDREQHDRQARRGLD
jgi:hypothetical protein